MITNNIIFSKTMSSKTRGTLIGSAVQQAMAAQDLAAAAAQAEEEEDPTPLRVPYVDRTPTELAVLRVTPQVFDGCDECPCCLVLLKVSLGKKPATSLYKATQLDDEMREIVDSVGAGREVREIVGTIKGLRRW